MCRARAFRASVSTVEIELLSIVRLFSHFFLKLLSAEISENLGSSCGSLEVMNVKRSSGAQPMLDNSAAILAMAVSPLGN
jgi:hypothetical protein